MRTEHLTKTPVQVKLLVRLLVDHRHARQVAWSQLQQERPIDMTREEAYAGCPSDSYVEFYGGRWLMVPYAPVEQPGFSTCLPITGGASSHSLGW